jgi:hypothetical protein
VPAATGDGFALELSDLLSPRISSTETLRIEDGARKAAVIAEAGEAFVALHQAQSPLNTAINAHIHASIPTSDPGML